MATIGFVGLGVMGGNIAARLLLAGHAVQGYNRTTAKAESLVELGMTLAATPRAAALGAGVVFSMVSDGDALTAVCTGPDGILAGLGEGSIYIDLSTVGPVASEAARIAAEEHRARFLAAPVSGSVSTIKEGRLSFMVGGSEEALAEVRPLLLDIGPEIRHVGSVQQAAAMKMAVNLSVAIQVIAFSEGVLLAERYGVDPGRAVDVLLHSVVASPMLAYRGRFLLDPPEVPWFTVALARKDVRIMQDMAERVDLPLWSAATAGPILAAVFGNLTLAEALDEIGSLGVRAVELGTGNYNGDAHCPPAELLADETALRRFRDLLADKGVMITALGCHGNPLHPDPAVAGPHDAVFRDTVLLAERLGVERITLLSGCPGDSEHAVAPNWVTCGWPTDFPAVLEWQWTEKAIPYWRERADFAVSHGVSKLCFEMHPGCLVYHPPSLLRLREAIGPVVGANLDPSHLMWQGMDVIEVVRRLGQVGVIYHVHAKDTALNDSVVRWTGVLDTAPLENTRERAWTFRTVGFGHDALFWKTFVSALRESGYDDVLSIEHEDPLAGRTEGVRHAVEFLRQCLLTEPPAEAWWT